MCGIAGVIETRRNASQEELLGTARDMASRLKHRGPDAAGEWADAAAGVALGHRRLAVIDLTPTGAQPMFSQNGRYVLVFNGEIYNFLELRSQLESMGVSFRGGSDTEVMLEAFSNWGAEASLHRFVGMFALALWDRQGQELLLARDRLGEKPLYYGWMGSHFLFGSELKALTAHPAWKGEIDRNALALFFRHQYIPAPWSIYQGIRKLPPGSLLRLPIGRMQPGHLPEPVTYWSMLAAAETGCRNRFSGTSTEAADHLDTLLKKVVAGQMIADVPLGAFLSGGVDSSTIVALMQSQSERPVKTFTIGFEDEAFNEAPYAARIAKHLGTEHTEIRVSAHDAQDIIPLLPDMYDEPFADQSQIPTYLVSKMAKRHVTVSLSGDGGDEVFCGYNRQIRVKELWELVRNVPQPIRKLFGRLLNVVPAYLYESALRSGKAGVLADQVQKLAMILPLHGPEEMYQRLTMLWDQPDRLVLGAEVPDTLLSNLANWPSLPEDIDRIVFAEYVTSLPDNMLVKVDRAAMAVSLETRVPFLDHRIVEFAWHLPLNMKVRNGMGKWILRQVLHRYVPRNLIERPKSGFDTPIDEWLKGPLRDWAEELLSPIRLREDGYLDPKPVQHLWKAHLNGRRKYQYQLWAVLMFQAWLDSIRSESY